MTTDHRFKLVLIVAVLTVAAAACSQEGAPADAANQVLPDVVFDSGGLDVNPGGADTGSETKASDTADGADTSDSGLVQCPGGPGCSCSGHAECETGLCLDDPNGGALGKACAKVCTTSCPTGYLCAAVTDPGGDISNVCVWKSGHLCEPCAASQDCASPGLANTACIDQAQLGRFCGIACDGVKSCPVDYSCQAVTTVEGGKLDQCVRNADSQQAPYGVCLCSPIAVAKKLSTGCFVESKDASGNFIGKCPGIRTCESTGLSICSAAKALPELCNAIDDNCNGQTDETECDDSNDCTKDTCKGQAGCSFVKLDGTPCDADGSVCTKNDNCGNGACQKGSVTVCDDGNACTIDACLPAKGCTQTQDDGALCSDDNACTTGDSCKAGQCSAGKPKICESFSNCTLGQCELTTGKCVPSPVADGSPCTDGTACTGPDGCKNGVCTGKAAICDDGNPCSTDSCDAIAGCTSTAAVMPCNDGNACTDKDTCAASKCSGSPIDPVSGCDDKSPCTKDSCDAKTGCLHLPINDNAVCTGCGEIACKCSVGVCKPDCVAVDGGWSVMAWSECSVKCGGGTQSGKRTCTSPKPSCVGKFCEGSATAVQACNTQACPPPELAKGVTVFDKGGQVVVLAIPVGATAISVSMWGGGGGGGQPGNGGGAAWVSFGMPVKAGDTVEFRVAEAGPPAGGGGGTYVFRNGSYFAIAAGGGGAGVDGCSGCTGGSVDGAGGGAGPANGSAQAGTVNSKYSTNCGGGGGGTQVVGGAGGDCKDQSSFTQCIVTDAAAELMV